MIHNDPGSCCKKFLIWKTGKFDSMETAIGILKSPNIELVKYHPTWKGSFSCTSKPLICGHVKSFALKQGANKISSPLSTFMTKNWADGP